jgi:hypothetical protein
MKLTNEYQAFIWTADETQKEDPVWFNDFIRVGKGHIINSGCTGVFIKSINGEFNRGDVVVRDGLGNITPWAPANFRSVFGEEQYEAMT